jgi:quinolinate synthase
MEGDERLNRIKELKKSLNAIILAHNYQIGEIQDAADFVGDSLELSRKAAEVKEDVIVFCGVHFMAETANVLAPEKLVLIPEISAGCPMADMITGEQIRQWKKDYPGLPVVSYVNTSAEVKAESDICCTSSNAVKVVESIEGEEILFAPDKNLASFVAKQTNKKVIPWDGYCYVHQHIMLRHVKEKREQYPEAEVWVHPECRPEVAEAADRVLSTGQMVKAAGETTLETVIIGTETGIIHRLKKENPSVRFFPAKERALCSNMKKITMDNLTQALLKKQYRVEVPAEIAERARGAIERMIRII